MKKVVVVGLILLLAASARADWKGLRNGMTPHAAWECTGVPLMQYGARGAEMWTFDSGGYILFENGRVTCWAEPKPATPPRFQSSLATQVNRPSKDARIQSSPPTSRANQTTKMMVVAAADTPS